MDRSGFLRVRAAFEAALERPAEERLAHLRARLADAPELRAEAERMLAGHDSDTGFLNPPSGETLAALARRAGAEQRFLAPGDRVGEFELVRPIGSGGMGEVWEARQERPTRSVALKTLRTGLGTERARRRFGEEAELLARLNHPNICQVLASGVLEPAEGGPPRPWFAMELIEDPRSLTEYAAPRPLRERLLLLRAVCVAVHHGHLRGVVHRDLKPDNCLVGGDGRVRVIDFGIARAGGVGAEAAPTLTGGGELLGTLAYMSPEQIRGRTDAIDVRTDVHALGVLLYELLTGRSPWRSTRSSWTALAREVCEVDPEPPSRAAPGLSRELDWVCARALAKAPEERYESAQDLADELGRFLHHEPLRAGPPTLAYAARKFVRRNRAWVVGGAVAATLALLGSAGTGWGLYRSLERGRELALRGAELERATAAAVAASAEAEAARAQAEERLDRATMINRFLDRMLRGSDPMHLDGAPSRETTVGDMLQRASREIETAFPDRPMLEADTRLLIGVAFYGQGRYGEARGHLERARELFVEDPERDFERFKISRLLAALTGRMGDPETAVRELRAVRDAAYATLDDDYPELGAIDCDLAWALQEAGALEASVPYAEAALARFEALGADFAPMAATAASHLARASRASGDDERTERAYRAARDRLAEAWGPESVQAGVAASNLGTFLFSRGRYAEARDVFEEARAVLGRALDGDHPSIATLLYNHAAALQNLGELDEAERVSLACLAMNERLYGPDHPETSEAATGVAYVRYDRGDFAGANGQFERAHARRLAADGPDHRHTIALRARVLDSTARGAATDAATARALDELEALWDRARAVHGADGWATRAVAAAGVRVCEHRAPARLDAWRARVAAQ